MSSYAVRLMRRAAIGVTLAAALLALCAPALGATLGDIPRWLDSDPDIRGRYETVRNSAGVYYLLPFTAPLSDLDSVQVHVHVGKDSKYVSVYAKILELPPTTPASAYAKLLEQNANSLVLARFGIVDGNLDFVHECLLRILDRDHLLAMVWDTANFVDKYHAEIKALVSGASESSVAPAPATGPSDATAAAQRSVVQVVSEGADGTRRGSGFVVASTIVLASRHVVDRARRVWVIPPGGAETLSAEILRGPATDVDACLLRVPGLTSPPLTMATKVEDGHRLGQDVWVVGFPEGDPNLTVTRGLLAGFTSREGVRCVKTTALVRGGSSGAPMLNARGEVIAVVWQSSDGGFSYGIVGDEVRSLAEYATRLPRSASYAVVAG